MMGRGVIVTGGSRGIGRSIVEALCAKGDRVLAVARNERALRDVASATGASICSADITDEEGREAVATTALAELGEVDALVNNAGAVVGGGFLYGNAAEMRAQVQIGLTAPMALSARVAAHMGAGGSIVFLSSTLAARPAVGRAAYAASKAGVEGLVRAMALELGPRGVRVNAVSPGVVPTEMITSGLGDSEIDVEAGLEALRRLHPLGRLGTAGDVAGAVEYLLSADFVTGTVLTVDGGLTLG